MYRVGWSVEAVAALWARCRRFDVYPGLIFSNFPSYGRSNSNGMSGLALQVKRPSGLTTGRFHYRINLSPLFDPLEHTLTFYFRCSTAKSSQR